MYRVPELSEHPTSPHGHGRTSALILSVQTVVRDERSPVSAHGEARTITKHHANVGTRSRPRSQRGAETRIYMLACVVTRAPTRAAPARARTPRRLENAARASNCPPTASSARTTVRAESVPRVVLCAQCTRTGRRRRERADSRSCPANLYTRSHGHVHARTHADTCACAYSHLVTPTRTAPALTHMSTSVRLPAAHTRTRAAASPLRDEVPPPHRGHAPSDGRNACAPVAENGGTGRYRVERERQHASINATSVSSAHVRGCARPQA